MGFILNFLACAGTYYLLSITDSIETLYLSKIPSVCMAGFLCAQCAIAKITEEGPDRIVTLGRLTTAYTIGGVFGPYLGGILGSSGDYFVGAKYATIGSLIACVAVLALNIKEGDKDEKNKSKIDIKEDKD